MILGIGTDLVAIARINDSWTRLGDKLAKKILSPAEQQHLATLADPTLFLAGRFAAKEALAKAFGTGMRDGLWFTQFTVLADQLGKPVVSYHGKAAKVANFLDVLDTHLTLTHERDYVLAFAVLER